MAQAKMGARYGSGKGIKQNLALSFKYREMAALQEMKKPLLKLADVFGRRYCARSSTRCHFVKRAATSYQKPTEPIYKNGAKGIAPDPAAAKMWKKKAAALEKAYKEDNSSILDSLGAGN
jgi:TPR repeat protein